LVEPAIHSQYASKTIGLEKDNVAMVFNKFLKFILFDFLKEKQMAIVIMIYTYFTLN